MEAWVVTFTFERGPDEEQLVGWEERLADHDGSVGQHDHGFDATVYVNAANLFEAVDLARGMVGPVIDHPSIGVEVVTETEWFRRAAAPTLPEIVSAGEVAEILGVSRQRVHQLAKSAGFPAPLLSLRTGPLWHAVAIRKFAEGWERKPGRPAKSA